MKQLYLILFIALVSTLDVFAGGGCTTTTNPTCPSLVTLTPGAACTSGTTCRGGAQATSSCLSAGSECSWYGFTATATDMFVEIAVTATDGCHISSNVYESTGSCTGTEISCLAGAPLDDLHALSGLTVGNLYYVQVCYAPGGPCGNNGSAEYCIRVGEPDPPCETCSTPCGTAAGYASAPTTQTVIDDCQTSPFAPELQPSSTNTFCYSFQATATSVDFSVIITSDCGTGGNVTNFSWELYDASVCGAPIQTGTLASLTFSPLVIGNDYVFCYTFDVPSICSHSQHCPYFVGAVVLNNNLTSFEAEQLEESNQLQWEIQNPNNDFVVQRSTDGINFENIATVSGNKYVSNNGGAYQYQTQDAYPSQESYYRLKWFNTLDGQTKYSAIQYISRSDLRNQGYFGVRSVYPNPVVEDVIVEIEAGESEHAYISMYNSLGQLVFRQKYPLVQGIVNQLSIPTANINPGLFTLVVEDKSKLIRQNRKLVKR